MTITMRKLEEDNHALRAQISLIKGEATSRENTIKLEIQQLRDEIGHLKKPPVTDTNTSITTHDGNARRTQETQPISSVEEQKSSTMMNRSPQRDQP